MANIFRSPRLVYRAIEDNDSDMEFLYSLLLESEATANADTRLMKPFNKADSDTYWRNEHDNAFLSVMICLPLTSDPEIKEYAKARGVTASWPIGRIGLWKTEERGRHHRKSNICIQIAAQEQRKGYGSEAIQWVMKWAFRMAGFHRVGITHFSYNEGAGRLYERLGFVREGCAREALWFDGGWHDYLSLGILESEWRARYQEDAGGGEGKKASVGSSKELEKVGNVLW
jgi:RimJ/RimL family protein N-acetyltransferase